MDGGAFAVGSDVLKQHLSRKLFASLDPPRNTPVRDSQLELTPALASEKEAHGRSADGYVPVAERGETERSVVARVLLVADPRIRHLEQSHDGRDHLLAGQAWLPKVTSDAPPDSWQGASEADHARKLVCIANRAPCRVVQRLLAAPSVAAGGLEVTPRPRGNPDILPGGRNDEIPDPLQGGVIRDPPAVRAEIGGTLSFAQPAAAGLLVARINQAGLSRFGRPDLQPALGGVSPGPSHPRLNANET